MQEASGADLTDFNRPAQASSADLDTDHRLQSFPGSSFTPLIQATARRAVALNCILHGWRLRASRSREHLWRVAKLHRREFGTGPVLAGALDRSSGRARRPIWYTRHQGRGRCRRAAEGQRAASGRRNMMIDCLCVCHCQFQNEVIGG